MKKLKRVIIFLLCIAVILPILKSGYGWAKDEFFPIRYEEHIERYARENNLSEYLVMGVIRAESKFESDAHSDVARGLMQITDETAKWLSGKLGIKYQEDMVEDPETSIKMGCYYLRYLINKYENEETALAAYNAGPGNVDSWLSDEKYSEDGKTLSLIPFDETDKYVGRVNIYKNIYERLY